MFYHKDQPRWAGFFDQERLRSLGGFIAKINLLFLIFHLLKNSEKLIL